MSGPDTDKYATSGRANPRANALSRYARVSSESVGRRARRKDDPRSLNVQAPLMPVWPWFRRAMTAAAGVSMGAARALFVSVTLRLKRRVYTGARPHLIGQMIQFESNVRQLFRSFAELPEKWQPARIVVQIREKWLADNLGKTRFTRLLSLA